MTATIESMAYVREQPWHGIGKEVTKYSTPKAIMKAASLDWAVKKKSVYLKSGKVIKDKFALVRDKDEEVLSMVGTTYKPVQNEQAFDFFTKFVKAGDMKMEHAGSLANGRYIWALASLNNNFTLGKDDEVRGNILLLQPHVHGKAMVIQFCPVRSFCWNTLSFKLGAGLDNKRQKGREVPAFRMPHTLVFNDAVKLAAHDALGVAVDQMKELKQATTLLAKKKATSDEVQKYFQNVLRFDPKNAKKKNDGEPRTPRMLPKFEQALECAPGQDVSTARGTWWGALNAVTYVVDHETGRDRGTAMRNAWIGNTSNMKRRAFELALDSAR